MSHFKEVFLSRRNKVWREGDAVYKKMLPESPDSGAGEPAARASFEADMLKRLHASGVCVPRLISVSGDVIVMQYVQGLTLTRYIEAKEMDLLSAPWSPDDVAVALADWFQTFYAAAPSGCIRGDVNCRNFLILPGGAIAGVDFERGHFGEKEADLGRLLAFVLTYDPMYTPFKREFADLLCAQFTGRFSLDPTAVSREREKELEAIKIRRNRAGL